MSDGGVYLRVVDLNQRVQQLSEPPIIVNDFDISSEEDKKRLNSMIITKYDGDTLDTLPSCDCRYITGVYNAKIKCPRCNTICDVVTERELKSVLWIETPEGVRSLINPNFYIMLSELLDHGELDLLEWLTNTNYKAKVDTKRFCERYLNAGYKRGLNYFIDNFDEIFDFLLKIKAVKKVTSVRDKEELLQLFAENKKALFPGWLPIPSKLSFITENTAMGTYADTNMSLAVDAIHTITSIKSGLGQTPQNVRENRTAKAIKLLASFYYLFYRESLSSKGGHFRKHIYGSRLCFSFRAVISSISDNHNYDEMYLPWSLSVALFKAHLTNKLMKKYKMTPNECIEFLHSHTHCYSPVLDALFHELLAETKHGYFRAILQRNPTLVRLSAQYLKVPKIKTDPSDITISMSVLALKGLR